MFISGANIILASGSPRRQAYLHDLGIAFTVMVADIDETPIPDETPRSYVSRMACEKCLEVMKKQPDSWVIAADTIVSVDNMILGKPKSFDDAVNTLMLLCGRQHEVATVFCLGLANESIFHEECVITKVQFINFTEEIAKAYVSTGEPLDKAGAYGIQGRGAFLVSEVEGSYSNVVGLPLSELMAVLHQYKIVNVR